MYREKEGGGSARFQQGGVVYQRYKTPPSRKKEGLDGGCCMAIWCTCACSYRANAVRSSAAQVKQQTESVGGCAYIWSSYSGNKQNVARLTLAWKS